MLQQQLLLLPQTNKKNAYNLSELNIQLTHKAVKQ
jgi:hypothetical protein